MVRRITHAAVLGMHGFLIGETPRGQWSCSTSTLPVLMLMTISLGGRPFWMNNTLSSPIGWQQWTSVFVGQS